VHGPENGLVSEIRRGGAIRTTAAHADPVKVAATTNPSANNTPARPATRQPLTTVSDHRHEISDANDLLANRHVSAQTEPEPSSRGQTAQGHLTPMVSAVLVTARSPVTPSNLLEEPVPTERRRA
jgi:hypothetical protein